MNRIKESESVERDILYIERDSIKTMLLPFTQPHVISSKIHYFTIKIDLKTSQRFFLASNTLEEITDWTVVFLFFFIPVKMISG